MVRQIPLQIFPDFHILPHLQLLSLSDLLFSGVLLPFPSSFNENLHPFIQSARIIKIFCRKESTDTDLLFPDNRVSVMCKRNIASSAHTEIKNQHLIGKEAAVSFRPAICVNPVKTHADPRCEHINVYLSFLLSFKANFYHCAFPTLFFCILTQPSRYRIDILSVYA